TIWSRSPFVLKGFHWTSIDYLYSVAEIGTTTDRTTGRRNYLAGRTQFPILREDITVPDYVYMSPGPPVSYPNYRPPSNEDQLVINVWFGPKGTISPAHTVNCCSPRHVA
ncbi:hypothetical protein EDC04DRAFT_2781048, partial [Pisolithus marmoratus]